MYRILLSATAGVMMLALNGPAQAGHGNSHSTGLSHSYVSNSFVSHNGLSHNYATSNLYVQKYGTKFSHGYSFAPSHFYWNSRYWSSRYGCYCYWCPYASCYYYWYAPRCCYYPISYITIAPPPVAVATPPGAGGPGGPVPSAGSMPPAGPPIP